TADLDDPAARLTVREHAGAPAVALPRSAWRFADPSHVSLHAGFEPGKIYELVYRAENPPLVGLGLAAVRDTGAWLRFAAAAARYSRDSRHAARCRRSSARTRRPSTGVATPRSSTPTSRVPATSKRIPKRASICWPAPSTRPARCRRPTPTPTPAAAGSIGSTWSTTRRCSVRCS